jgi:hypothetical protein
VNQSIEQEFSGKTDHMEIERRSMVIPEQINGMKEMPYGYGSQSYARKPDGR